MVQYLKLKSPINQLFSEWQRLPNDDIGASHVLHLARWRALAMDERPELRCPPEVESSTATGSAARGCDAESRTDDFGALGGKRLCRHEQRQSSDAVRLQRLPGEHLSDPLHRARRAETR